MREIKFRAWDKRNKRMLPIIQAIHFEPEGDMSHPYNCVEFVIPNKAAGYIPLDTIILEQFTGLKDKNGTEIYEGDIVKRITKRVVEWEGIGWNPFEDDVCDADDGIYYEIIGNIHQNPELLEDKQCQT